MKKFIAPLVIVIALISGFLLWYFYFLVPGHTSELSIKDKKIDSLVTVLKNTPTKEMVEEEIRNEAELKKAEVTGNEFVKKVMSMVSEIDTSLAGIDPEEVFEIESGTSTERLSTLPAMGSSIKVIVDKYPSLQKAVANPDKILDLYVKYKSVLLSLKSVSDGVSMAHQNGAVISNYFQGKIDPKVNTAMENFFKKFDSKKEIYFVIDGDEPEAKALVALFDGESSRAEGEYKIWLSAKRQRARFGDKWMKTFAVIMADFGKS
jgi:hypothetical protein